MDRAFWISREIKNKTKKEQNIASDWNKTNSITNLLPGSNDYEAGRS